MMSARRLFLGLSALAGMTGSLGTTRAAVQDEPLQPSLPRTLTSDARVERDGTATAVEVPPPSPKALRYYRGGNVIWTVEQLVSIGIPLLLLLSGLSAWLRTFASQLVRGRFYPTLAVYFVMLSVLLFLVELPLSYYVGFAREHAYGLSVQCFSKWAVDQLKGFGVGVVLGVLVL